MIPKNPYVGEVVVSLKKEGKIPPPLVMEHTINAFDVRAACTEVRRAINAWLYQ
jgi:hypothetical protein